MTVDSFKFLPCIIAAFYKMTELEPRGPIPWTPLQGSLRTQKFGLVTSAGLYLKRSQQPFDLGREKAEPTWGDPSFRAIPADVGQDDLAVSHLHLNTMDAETDFNILLPIQRMKEFAEQGRIGALADQHYSLMGFQGFPPDTRAWEMEFGPQVAQALLNEGVHCVLLTPA